MRKSYDSYKYVFKFRWFQVVSPPKEVQKVLDPHDLKMVKLSDTRLLVHEMCYNCKEVL